MCIYLDLLAKYSKASGKHQSASFEFATFVVVSQNVFISFASSDVNIVNICNMCVCVKLVVYVENMCQN